MDNKDRFLGLRFTGDLKNALEAYCSAEDRSLSSAVRFLLASQLREKGYLTHKAAYSPNRPRRKAS